MKKLLSIFALVFFTSFQGAHAITAVQLKALTTEKIKALSREDAESIVISNQFPLFNADQKKVFKASNYNKLSNRAKQRLASQ